MLNLVSVAQRSILLLQLAAGATGRGLTSLNFALSIALLDDTTSAGCFFHLPSRTKCWMPTTHELLLISHFSTEMPSNEDIDMSDADEKTLRV